MVSKRIIYAGLFCAIAIFATQGFKSKEKLQSSKNQAEAVLANEAQSASHSQAQTKQARVKSSGITVFSDHERNPGSAAKSVQESHSGRALAQVSLSERFSSVSNSRVESTAETEKKKARSWVANGMKGVGIGHYSDLDPKIRDRLELALRSRGLDETRYQDKAVYHLQLKAGEDYVPFAALGAKCSFFSHYDRQVELRIGMDGSVREASLVGSSDRTPDEIYQCQFNPPVVQGRGTAVATIYFPGAK